MASKLIGRCTCPECGFKSAHVKIKEDKEGANPYRHCPECGAQYFPRNKHQAGNLMQMLRPETQTPTQTPAGTQTPAPVPNPKPAPAPAPAPAGKKGFLEGVFD